jgi:hypothetical protein
MLAMRDAGPIGAVERFDSDELIDRLETRRKRRRIAYLRWLLLGSHYLYLGRPLVQLLFWATVGGLLFWWVADFFRMPALVAAGNRRAAGALLREWRTAQPEVQPRSRWFSRAGRAIPLFAEGELAAPALGPLASPPGRVRKGAAIALVLAMLTIVMVQLLAPRPFYPHNLADPSYRTVRQVNAREAPSTASPIRAKIESGVVLSGEIEEVSTAGPTQWLRITRGRHADRYVAMANLRDY